MTQQAITALLRGGLNVVSPAIAIPPGLAIACINYEPDVAGYTSSAGFERFDGRDRPSDSSVPATIASRRAAINAVPGTGPVRGVHVFDGHVYAFRDQDGATGGMFRDSSGGWVQMTFGHILFFSGGDVAFLEGLDVSGATSSAVGTIDRVVLQDGAWDGTASGYLILSEVGGTFTAEVITDSDGGTASATSIEAITLPAGGKYSFTNHNFYGSGYRPRMYFANGVGRAHEWTGTSLAPIYTGVTAGSTGTYSYVLTDGGDFVFTDGGDFIILSAEYDQPAFVEHYKNHLFLAFSSGSLINSSIGEPLEYISTTGAAEIAFGDLITGLLTAASTSMMVFGNNRIEYITGDDADTFNMLPISDKSGAAAYTAQMMDSPTFLDDGGVRQTNATAAFGDWRMGTLTQAIEPLIIAKRDAGVTAQASVKVKARDQYKLFYDDTSGLTVYLGRKSPEAMPFKLPISVLCACSGEVDLGRGDRIFVGSEDGYVYELNRGTSFDGEPIETYVRLPFNAVNSPSQNKVFKGSTLELSAPDPVTFGVKFDIDYGNGIGGAEVPVDAAAGTPTLTTEVYDSIIWSQPVQSRLEHRISGLGLNIAVTYITEHDDIRPHTLSAQTFNYSPRKLRRRAGAG